ncbi:PAS domain S-box protein [Bacillus sp. PS06]|uniref:PAS domain S-box protein n=1 Tax=Bacillus sp. PS06 TaxID=2764176 RepID=UPI00178421CB|nr:PAS domain S-box protein [Bacillus sp. PS06]MBD8068496.1 PAS domain S-box protein [Bacillus sp. PS06]
MSSIDPSVLIDPNIQEINIVASFTLSGKILYISSSCEHLLGFSQEELIGSSLKDYTHPDDVFLVESNFFYQKLAHSFTFRLRTKNQQYIWLRADIDVISDQHKHDEVFAKMQRIVDPNSNVHKQAINLREETRINELFEENTKLIDLTPIAIIVTKNGYIQYMNQQSKNLLGCSNGTSLMGIHLLEFVDQEYHMVITKGIKMIANGLNLGLSEQRWISKNGEHIEVELKAAPVSFMEQNMECFVVHNISSKKRFQRVLQNSRERYEKIIHNSIDAIAVIYDDTWVFINDSGVKMFGAKDYTELLGQNIYSLLNPKYHNQTKDMIRNVMEENKEHTITKQSWSTLNGKQIYTEFVCIPTTFVEKPAVQVIIRDITDRKNVEDLMLKSEKLSIAGQLAAGIAHEIRNPLTSIKGFLQLIQTHTKENENYFHIIFSELNRVELILSELLVLAKPTEDAFHQVDVREVLQDVVTLLDTQAILQNIQIHLDLPNVETYIYCDQNQIKQVFVNLIKNSIESMQNGGNLFVTISFCHEHVIIEFRDEGCGIPEMILDRIGEPFYTTKEKGTGLGLMVSYKIIENHNGLISVKSKINEGTTFKITLPKFVSQ